MEPFLSQASVGTRRSCTGCQLSRHALRCARTTRLTTLLAACALGSSCWYTSNKPTQDHPTQFRHGCSCHLSQKESMSWRHGNLRPGMPSFTDPCIRRCFSSFLFTPCHGTILRVTSCSTQLTKFPAQPPWGRRIGAPDATFPLARLLTNLRFAAPGNCGSASSVSRHCCLLH